MDNLLQSKKIDMNTVLFARVSTREQAEEGYSLPAQEKLSADHRANRLQCHAGEELHPERKA